MKTSCINSFVLTPYFNNFSTRGDLFPAILCDQLASMQSSAPTHSFAYTQASLLASFKDSSISLVERLKDIESRPVASGSIAQVHRAHMFLTSPNDPPHTVAVKVRHPQVVQLLQLDFELMQMLAKFCDSFPSLQHLRVSETLTQFSNTLAAQTDLRLEACHLAQLRRYFKASSSVFKNTYDHGTSHSSNHGTSPSTITSFPEPIFATEDILIESFEEGEGVAQLAKRLASSSQLIPRNGPLSLIQGHRYLQQSEDEDLAYFVVTHGEFVYLQMLLRDRFMHADLHPGNILLRRQQHRHPYDQPNQASEPVTTNSIYAKGIHTHSSPSSSTSHTEPSSLVLTLVDAGLVARMTVDEQERFVELLRAIAEGDGNVAARALLSFSSNNAAYLSPTDVATFTTEIVALFSQVARGYGTHTVLGDVLRGALVIMQRHRVRVDANYATLVVNALCLDGLATTMLPGYNVLDGARQLFSLHKVVTKVVPRRWQPKALRMLFPFAAWLKERSDRAWRKAQRRQAQLSHQEY